MIVTQEAFLELKQECVVVCATQNEMSVVRSIINSFIGEDLSRQPYSSWTRTL